MLDKISEIFFLNKEKYLFFKSKSRDLSVCTYPLVMTQSLLSNNSFSQCSYENYKKSKQKIFLFRSDKNRLISAYNKKIKFRDNDLNKLFLLKSTGLANVESFADYLRVLSFRKQTNRFIDRHFQCYKNGCPHFFNIKIDIDNIDKKLLKKEIFMEIFSNKIKSSELLSKDRKPISFNNLNDLDKKNLQSYIGLWKI